MNRKTLENRAERIGYCLDRVDGNDSQRIGHDGAVYTWSLKRPGHGNETRLLCQTLAHCAEDISHLEERADSDAARNYEHGAGA